MALLSQSFPPSLTRHWRLAMWGMIAGLILLPAVAMQFTREVAWGVEDFAFAAILLGGAGLCVELASRKLKTARAKLIAGTVIGLVVVLIWAQAAVGII